jgi:hypothetical protein
MFSGGMRIPDAWKSDNWEFTLWMEWIRMSQSTK